MPESTGEDHTTEHEPGDTFYHAARFDHEGHALAAYADLQRAIKGAPCDLSTYRFLLNQVSHVAVIGQRPSAELEELLQSLLAAGEAASLPDAVLEVLQQRRRQASRHGSWVEGHYRPGIWLPGEGDE